MYNFSTDFKYLLIRFKCVSEKRTKSKKKTVNLKQYYGFKMANFSITKMFELFNISIFFFSEFS